MSFVVILVFFSRICDPQPHFLHTYCRNKSVANRLALPDTHFLLDYVRPDLLLHRVVARSLILWDDVEPSSDWIEDQIPEMIRWAFDHMVKKAESSAGYAGLASLAALHLHPPSENSPSHELANENDANEINEDVAVSSQSPPSATSKAPLIEADIDDMDIDRQAIRQAHVHIVAGACFSLGLRYAGSGNQYAATAVMERVEHFIRLRDESDAISVALRPERPILEMCLCCAAISLAMVMAGTGDVETFKLLRAIRWKCDEGIRYGTHMALGSAIGLLFLGGGTCTLGTDPEDIAALVMAFFPRFPMTSSDNQYHLQALRHCYALAVKRRLLEAIDIDTREKVFVPLEVVLNGKFGDPVKLTAPCLLLNKGVYSHLRVVSDRYYPASLDLQISESSDSNLSLFVKKKAGHLSYLQDPHAHRSLLVQTGGSGSGSAIDLIQAFTEDKTLLAYARYLCDDGRRPKTRRIKSLDKKVSNGLGSCLEEFCTEILHECLTNEKTEALRLYLALRQAVTSTTNGALSSESMWDIRHVRSYYEGMQQDEASLATTQQSPLLSSDIVSALCESLDSYFAGRGLTGAALMAYLETGGHWQQLSRYDKNLLACFLTYHDVPFPNGIEGASFLNEVLQNE